MLDMELNYLSILFLSKNTSRFQLQSLQKYTIVQSMKTEFSKKCNVLNELLDNLTAWLMELDIAHGQLG